jgi:hypothetical protein
VQVRLVHPDKLQMDTEAEKLKTQQAFRGIYMRSKFSFAVCTCVEKNLATDNLQMDTEAEKLKAQQAFGGISSKKNISLKKKISLRG